MNTLSKCILVGINVIMLALAIKWYSQNKEFEPLIVIFGQFAALFTLAVDALSSKIITEKVKSNSKVRIENENGGRIRTTDIDNSDIEIKNK